MNDEKSTEQCPREPVTNEDINTSTGLQNKRSNYNILQDNITTLKADVMVMKNFMMQGIFNITQRIKNIEQTNCRDQVKHLREENNSKNEIIKYCPKIYLALQFLQIHQFNVERLRKIEIMLYQVPQKISKQHNSSTGNTDILTLPNRFENLRLLDDSTNMSFQNKRTDNPSFISNSLLVLHESVRMQNKNNKHNTFASHKSRRPSICTTKKYLQNVLPQQILASGIASYASATKSKNEKVYILGGSHLKRINKRQLEKNLAKDLATLNILVVRIPKI